MQHSHLRDRTQAAEASGRSRAEIQVSSGMGAPHRRLRLTLESAESAERSPCTLRGATSSPSSNRTARVCRPAEKQRRRGVGRGEAAMRRQDGEWGGGGGRLGGTAGAGTRMCRLSLVHHQRSSHYAGAPATPRHGRSPDSCVRQAKPAGSCTPCRSRRERPAWLRGARSAAIPAPGAATSARQLSAGSAPGRMASQAGCRSSEGPSCSARRSRRE